MYARIVENKILINVANSEPTMSLQATSRSRESHQGRHVEENGQLCFLSCRNLLCIYF
jgi:hypothetical protein